MPRLIWLLKIIAPTFNKVKNLPLISTIVNKFGFATERKMPEVQSQDALKEIYNSQPVSENKVILFADTFNINFENKNLIYSIKVINKFGYQAIIPSYGKDNLSRPLCCGRTYISYGQLDKAASELNRFNDYILENNYYDLPVVGIEPSCLLTFNDEYLSLKNVNNREKIKNKFYLLEEFILDQLKINRNIKVNDFDQNVLIHGHCHQKSQDRMNGLKNLLSELKINNKMIESSCCGMAGSFGYDSKNYEVSKKMANLSLIPSINSSNGNDFIVANGTSCRHQISDLSEKKGKHISELLFKIFETVN
jgi:Fe-S oxidoreductase